jgi:hypothetical protein
MDAAWQGETDVVVELVKGGANLDLQNKVCIVMNTGYRILLSLSHTCLNFLLRSLSILTSLSSRFLCCIATGSCFT